LYQQGRPGSVIWLDGLTLIAGPTTIPPLPITAPGRRIPISAVRDAAGSIYQAAIRTPLLRLDLRGTDFPIRELYLKLELLQPIGSFKIRGAYNVIRQLPASELAGGVWTVSAGNAAQGVAFAAREAGVRASVMVMDTTPDTKIWAIERFGASIVRATYDECWRTVVAHGSDRMHGYFIHPFDDDRFIAGNGTLALEIFEDLPEVDAIVAPVGGGGLLAGIAAVAADINPRTRLYAAEPVTAAPLAASLAAREPVYFKDWTASFVDGAGGKSILPTMWPLLNRLSGSIVVSLDEVAAAMSLLAERAHLIAEGAAGCALAVALGGHAGTTGNVVAVISGGNIDLPKFASLVGACPP
jgi:threonine dehydratase